MGYKSDEEQDQRRYQAPKSSHHPIPTVQQYHREKEDRQAYANTHNNYSQPRNSTDEEESKDPANRYLFDDEQHGSDSSADNGTNSAMQHIHAGLDKSKHLGQKILGRSSKNDSNADNDNQDTAEDTSQAVAGSMDPKARRKGMQKRKGERAEREVTDPVTHLPVRIHDLTGSDLKKIPENDPPPGCEDRTATGLSNKSKSDEQLDKEEMEMRVYHQSMENHFPPPEFDAIRRELASLQTLGLTIGLVSIISVALILLAVERLILSNPNSDISKNRFSIGRLSGGFVLICMSIAALSSVVLGVRRWMDHQIHSLWEEELWHSSKREDKEMGHTEETTHWLNSMLSSIWPLVNPDLFISLADTLEDVMQASLPSVVRAVSVEDIGQGSESIRILGVRWLPTGAAARSVTADGKLQSHPPPSGDSDRSVPGEGQADDNADNNQKQKGPQDDDDQPESKRGEEEQMAEGMEAEEGDFINLEVAFAYRTRSKARKFKDKAQHAHLYMAFYLPGRIKVQCCPQPAFHDQLLTYSTASGIRRPSWYCWSRACAFATYARSSM